MPRYYLLLLVVHTQTPLGGLGAVWAIDAVTVITVSQSVVRQQCQPDRLIIVLPSFKPLSCMSIPCSSSSLLSLSVCLQSSLPRACRRLGGRRATSSWPSLGASPRAIVVSLAPCFHFLSLPFSIMQPSSVDIKVKHLVIIRHSLCTPVPDHFLYCSAVPLFLLTASTALPWKHH